jgi:hypothetical protein
MCVAANGEFTPKYGENGAASLRPLEKPEACFGKALSPGAWTFEPGAADFGAAGSCGLLSK